MNNIKSTEEAKKAILDKIAAKLADEAKENVRAVNHGAHSSMHCSHGNHGNKH